MLICFVTASLRVLRTSAFALAAICLAASSLNNGSVTSTQAGGNTY